MYTCHQWKCNTYTFVFTSYRVYYFTKIHQMLSTYSIEICLHTSIKKMKTLSHNYFVSHRFDRGVQNKSQHIFSKENVQHVTPHMHDITFSLVKSDVIILSDIFQINMCCCHLRYLSQRCWVTIYHFWSGFETLPNWAWPLTNSLFKITVAIAWI